MSKKQFLSIVLLTSIAAFFWSGSRYPRLNAKAAMAGEIPLSETLSFERVFDYEPTAPVYERTYYSLLNWIATNKKGMLFGFLFGAAFLTLIPTLRIKPSASRFRNSILGTMTGAPLGVCVNCAAPIGNAIFKSIGKSEFSLAAMLSSPTLNIIVLTMLFTMFPPHLITLKLGFTFFTLLILIPWLAKRDDKDNLNMDNVCVIGGQSNITQDERGGGWLGSIISILSTFLRNLLWIVAATGPLMIVAGALGAGLTQVIDLKDYMGEFSFINLLGVAVVGTFLPAPIALDLILAQAFLSAGVNDAYVMALLFTLGIYSIYACFIVWKAISRRIALTLYASIVIMGVCSGYMAKFYAERQYQDSLEVIDEELSALQLPGVAFAAATSKSPSDYPMIPNDSQYLGTRDGVVIFRKGMVKRPKSNSEGFSMEWGEEVGLYRPIEFSILDSFTPFFFSRGMAAGDYDNDGWEDIVIAAETGFRLFHNEGGKRFSVVHVKGIQGIVNNNLMLVALVDVDNDGWLDVFGTSYGQGEAFYLRNNMGQFTNVAVKIPNPNAITVNAATFGDLDIDGDLDLVLGNWYMGFTTKLSPNQSKNILALNERGIFRSTALPAVPGETLTTLFSDINSDGKIDLVVGNDFSRPDVFYLGNGKGILKQTDRKEFIPYTTKYTMSVDTADVNNDLKLDMYLAQITGDFDNGDADDYEEYSMNYCDEITNQVDKKICRENIRIKDILLYRTMQLSNVKKCKSLRPKSLARDCMAQVVTIVAIKENRSELCAKIPERYKRNRFWCQSYFARKAAQQDSSQTYVKQIEKRNVMLVANGRGGFDEVAKQMNIDLSGWSWNAKFADLNNDSWQDLYVANGYWLTPQRYNNSVFLNQQGRNFATPKNGYGLDDTMDVSTYIYSDFDGDGDIDIISSPVNGPIKVFRNNEEKHSSLSISLRDQKGNTHCIGCKIYIFYGDGEHQMREIKSGGGFQSYEAPKAHFGLGLHRKVSRIKVEWSDGQVWLLDQTISANYHYFIERTRS